MVLKRKRDAGVTLLEVLVVVAIIAMVATLAAPRVLDGFGRAKSQTATVQLTNLKTSMQLFYLDVGRFPTEAEGLDALLAEPQGVNGWLGPYIDEPGLTDPWGRRFLYQGPTDTSEFEVFTFGRDGQPGGNREDSDIRL